MSKQPNEIVDELFGYLGGPRGQEQYGEGVTQLEHALQCAYFASKATDDPETIVAALLHDIGHVCDQGAEQMGDVGIVDHEGIGATYLARLGFPQKVSELVGAHVTAKRYLVATNPNYELSAASAETLRYQGGPMNAEEVAAFERDPLRNEKLRMRSWDEMGKEIDFEVPELESYREMVATVWNG